MRLFKIIAGCFWIFFIAAFSKKQKELGLREETVVTQSNDTNKHLACRPPSRSVALSTGENKTTSIDNGNAGMVLIPGRKISNGIR